MATLSHDVRTSLGLDRFASAARTPAAGPVGRAVATILGPILRAVLRVVGHWRGVRAA